MTLEAILAYCHLLAILTMVIIASEAALCRVHWLNCGGRRATGTHRHGLWHCGPCRAGDGGPRTWWGIKGTAWYWTYPLPHVKLALLVVIGVLSIFPKLTYFRWRKALRTDGTLPSEADIRKTRRLVMVQAHLIAVIPLAAVFLARGFGK